MQIKLCKLHNAKQIIRDKLRKYIKKHQLSQKIKLNLSKKCLIREKVVTFRMVKLNLLLSIFLITK